MLKLHDTMTRRKLEARPNDGKNIRIYCCGPTVYGPAHIGNLRAFLAQDLLRRTLEADGASVQHVRNLTDVDDKTITGAKEAGDSLADFTKKWTQLFHADAERLLLLAPHVEPKATAHVGEQVELIQKLVERGVAYEAADGSVYFSVNDWQNYGMLSRLHEREISSDTGVQRHGGSSAERGVSSELDKLDGKRSQSDFALWKAWKLDDGDNFWLSPWGSEKKDGRGKGRPGWHLECSAMSVKYLGNDFDIHSGGVDLIFPHHENEIAQSEAASGKRFARIWHHVAHLSVEGEKMSKSLGNLYTLDDLMAKAFAPVELRYLLLATHYRKPLNFTFDALRATRSALTKIAKFLRTFADEVKADIKANLLSESVDDSAKAQTHLKRYRQIVVRARKSSLDFGVFESAWACLLNDLNASATLGKIFTAINKYDFLAKSRDDLVRDFRGLCDLLVILGIDPIFINVKDKAEVAKVPAEIREIAERRWLAKSERNWVVADELRVELDERGWLVKDSRDAYELTPK